LCAEIALVISDNPKAGALKILESRNIFGLVVEREAFRERDAFESALVSLLESRQVELVVLAGFMRLLGKHFINNAPGPIINVHPSLLPAFPGLKAQKQALDYGVKVSGCTVHFVNEVMDGGRIIAQAVAPVHPDDTENTLSGRILAEEHRLLPQVIGWLGQVLRAPNKRQ
ncbi:MAG: phosphoribosylglycinamide formyltransferase, partial [Candidatus Adiutrix sp.]